MTVRAPCPRRISRRVRVCRPAKAWGRGIVSGRRPRAIVLPFEIACLPNFAVFEEDAIVRQEHGVVARTEMILLIGNLMLGPFQSTSASQSGRPRCTWLASICTRGEAAAGLR